MGTISQMQSCLFYVILFHLFYFPPPGEVLNYLEFFHFKFSFCKMHLLFHFFLRPKLFIPHPTCAHTFPHNVNILFCILSAYFPTYFSTYFSTYFLSPGRLGLGLKSGFRRRFSPFI